MDNRKQYSRKKRKSRKQRQREIYALYAGLGVAVLLLVILVCSLFNKKPKAATQVDANKYEHRVDMSIDEKLGNVTPVPTEEGTSEPTAEATPEVTPTPTLDVIDQASLKETDKIDYLIGLSSNGHVIEIKNGFTYVEGFLIANKTYTLPSDFVPTNTTVDLTGVEYDYDGLDVDTFAAYEKMKADAAKEGLTLKLGSGYRSYDCQVNLYEAYAKRDGKDAADRYSARGGHSEHQTALCFDLSPVSDAFADTPEGKWVNENCWKYGLIIRYPKGKEEITGFKYESWHCRYLGEELAKTLYNNGDWITLEEHFGLLSKYND